MTSDAPRVLEAKREWLERLVRERFTTELVLDLSDEQWALRIPHADGAVTIARNTTALRGTDPACARWDASDEGFEAPLMSVLPAPGCPMVPHPLAQQRSDGWELGYDVLELAFWSLTRHEELGRTDLDDRDRFPAVASHAFKHGYLDRPIVDEWLEILGQTLLRQWPGLQLRTRRFATQVSHDADNPSRYAFGGLKPLARMLALDVVRRRDVGAAAKGVVLRARSRHSLQPNDPANTFDWIMEQSDQRGLTSAFHFLCGRTHPTLDAYYDPEDPRIRFLMRAIHDRGHEIGLHPSYGTYRAPDAVAAEFQRLRQVCMEEGIAQSQWGGRMHYLRWDSAATGRALNDAGLDYDNTLSYADAPGFRSGTCIEYPAFDPVSNEPLRLRIRPLVAMEATVIASRYLALGEGEQAFAKFAALKDACRSVRGTFSLLWHNTSLETDRLKELYCQVLDA
ncbi:polysaccharide deacetylase family protein [Phycicoccus endophyticus]|nr:polysaccharide deacetylase family protein [Phycicoccus endophyticus]